MLVRSTGAVLAALAALPVTAAPPAAAATHACAGVCTAEAHAADTLAADAHAADTLPADAHPADARAADARAADAHALSVPAALALPALGPPAVCHPFEIGSAPSLPWKDGTEGRSDYDLRALADDTAVLLAVEKDPIVRMETLRRAAVYASKDRARSWELLARAALAACDASSLGVGSEALRCLDLGFLIAVQRQLGLDAGARAGLADGVAGYAYLRRALELVRAQEREQGLAFGDLSASFDLACALAAHPAARGGGGTRDDRERYWRHVDAARASAPAGSLAARNVAAHEASWKRYVER